MKRIMFAMLLGLSVLCPVQSVFSASEADEARIAAIDKKIAVLEAAIAAKTGTTTVTTGAGKKMTVRRRVTKFDQASIDRWKKELNDLQQERDELEFIGSGLDI